MKRWLVVLLIALAIILLLSPGIIGRYAEKNLDDSIGMMDDGNDDIIVEAERFERGWFTSEGRHRITLRAGSLDGLLDAPGGGPSALIVDTRIDHGLVPVTSMSREQGSLQPGLASAVSTLRFDRGNGELIDLPGKIFSTTGLGGETAFRYLTGPGSQVAGNVSTRWTGADLTVTTSPRRRTISVTGSIEPASVESYGVTTSIGKISIDAEQDRRRYGYGIGSIDLDVEKVTVSNHGDADSGFGSLALSAMNALDDDRMNGEARIELDGLRVPDVGVADLLLDLDFGGLNADALNVIFGALARLNDAGRPSSEAELMSAYPAIERELETLAASGARIDVRELSVTLPQGEWHSTMRIEVPESDARDRFSWPSILLKTTAAADVRISAPLYDFILEVNPDAGALLAMGILKKSGDRYEMQAEYASGLLTINGAPMSVPLGVP